MSFFLSIFVKTLSLEIMKVVSFPYFLVRKYSNSKDDSIVCSKDKSEKVKCKL